MIKRTPIKIKLCKCGCNKPYTISCNGYNINCIPQLERDKKVNKHREARNKAQQRAKLTKRLHDAQRGVNVAHTAPKRPIKPIPKASKKRMAELKIYSVLRKDFLKDHPICECGIPDCEKKKSVDIHHTFMGRDRAKYFMVVETWKAVSRKDHIKIHALSTEQMVEYGLRKLEAVVEELPPSFTLPTSDEDAVD